MDSQHLMELIEKLFPAKQAVAEKFIEHLEAESEDNVVTFEEAMESFIHDHPNRLRWLAQ